ncbi:glycosyltransferase family protein [Burkholderia alba]|uniref:ADP-heptose--LPS heptosyltransferase n=1 Tax=Burkholderia alba TaxID=2683677 RepID=UPI002B05A808|nr:ADP-heptose--LPS heptosyltransferase [Burkholderia alba]
MTADRGPRAAAAPLSAREALVHPGTLLAPDGRLVAPYDLERAANAAPGYVAASHRPDILNAAHRPFRLDYASLSTVHVINGMGVALGDSVIGLTALAALRDRYPRLRFVLYRPAHAPAYVEALYRLAADAVAPSRSLPWPVAALPPGETRIDLGNHLYWPEFAVRPMIDFFLSALGAEPESIPAEAKRNRWLGRLTLPALPFAWRRRRYVLFCPDASTPLRSMPASQRAALVGRLADVYGLPVLGFEPFYHPAYVDVSPYSGNTAQFIAWVKHASVLLCSDTSAAHLADAFDVPTLACFSSIAPALRVRDYPHCATLELDVPAALRNRHTGASPAELTELEAAYRRMDWDAVVWPRARK